MVKNMWRSDDYTMILLRRTGYIRVQTNLENLENLEKTQGILMKFFKLRENSGKIFLKKDIIINYCLPSHYSFLLL